MILAEDTLQPSRPLVAIKVMKRHHTYTGQKASLPSWSISASNHLCMRSMAGAFVQVPRMLPFFGPIQAGESFPTLSQSSFCACAVIMPRAFLFQCSGCLLDSLVRCQVSLSISGYSPTPWSESQS